MSHEKNTSQRNSQLTMVWIIALAVAFCVLVFLLTDRQMHVFVSVGIILVLFLLKNFKDKPGPRVFFIFLASYMSIGYFIWRTFHTLAFYDPVSFFFALILYVAELYGFIIFAFTNFVNIFPLKRKPVPLPEDQSTWPSVDVFIPTYNEEFAILETTILAAIDIDYPADKLNIFLCDDGGTDQRCNHPDKELAKNARFRREQLSKFCRENGVTYIAREKNVHAKAGNLNAGLQNSNGELVLILDADHVPTRDILKKTTGLFLKDSKLFLVQTPHFFGNPDPIEKNLKTFYIMPGEGEMFYKEIQSGLDFWNGAFFCGSAAILRRRCLESRGGFSGDSITEDAETALTLHAAGYNSAYIDHPMVCGLAPESIPAFIQQRVRWAQGMLQIFLLKNPLFLRGLKLPQRICYLSSCFFWFFPFARFVFILSPTLFLFFGLKIYNTDATQFASYAVPHLVGVFMLSNFLFGRLRWTFVSDIYELIQSISTLPALINTLLKPRAPTFKVTAKGELLDSDRISPFAKPFYILFFINAIALCMGLYRLYTGVFVGAVSITMFWASINCVLLLACLGVMVERKQLRATPRMPANYPINFRVGERVWSGHLLDLSASGAGVLLKTTSAFLIPADSEDAILTITAGECEGYSFHVTIKNFRNAKEGSALGLQFKPKSEEENKKKVRLVYGDSQRWVDFLESRQRHKGIIASFFFVTWVGVKYSLEHFAHFVAGFLTRNRNAQPLSGPAHSTEEVYKETQKVYRVDASK